MLSQTVIPPEKFEGAEALTLPQPPKLPSIEGCSSTRSGTWVMAWQTTPTQAPPIQEP